MANSTTSGPTYVAATINTAPGADGYWTEAVNPRVKDARALFLSVSETGDSASFSATVTLQFKPPGVSDWQTYDTYTSETRQIIDDTTACRWRVGVDNGDYTDGEVTVTINW